ncbi:TonB-dependent receptor [Terricaulis silvestris]|uniref:Pesticin receptor n=1 Tax=Terricaulis silvestris TaxID=2686094 RepID=A0A6I6MG60_9CAUL|nr:TonB-dependent receptor [Terricaulis silvestris]QGZ93550.1 Pesticin receptor [Terricaulis silvestris]
MSIHARGRFWGTAASVFALMWCAGAPAMAQESDDSDEIIVTAQKREQNVLDVGIAVQSLSQETLTEQRIEQLRDLNAALPNVSIKEQIPGAIPVIAIRGVGLDDFSSTNNPAAGIYIDEVPLSSLALMSFDFFDLERVEVVRGPQGTLYGRNTTAGAINVLSARPADHFEARLFGGYGSFERAEAEAMLNLPLGPNAAFRVSGRYVDQGEGFWESRLLPGETIGEHNAWQARAQLAVSLGENWDANLKIEGLRQRSEMGFGEHFGTVSFLTGSPPNFTCDPVLAGQLDPTQCTDFLGYTDTDGDPFTGDWVRQNQYDIDQTNTTARIEGDLGFATLTSVTGYIDFERDFYTDPDASPARQFEFNQLDWVKQFTQEVRLSGEHDGLDWIVGAFYSSDDITLRTPGFLDDLFGTEVLISADQESTSLAAFGQAEWALTDRIDLITGVRFTTEEKDYVGGTLDQNPFGLSALVAMNPTCPGAALPCQLSFADIGIEDEFVSWRAGLDYRVNADTLLYASVSRGQKSGGFFTGVTQTDAQLVPYAPEELTAYEVGLKWHGPSLRAELSAFYYDYSDLQTFIRVDLGLISVQALGNVPEAEISGFEASLAWEPTENLTLQAGLGLLETELGAFETTGGPIPAGNEIPNAPGMSFNARAIYEWNVGSNLLARAQVGADYADGMFKDALNDPIIAAESYWLFDARLGVGSMDGNWEVALWGSNLSDEQYVVQGLNSGLGAGNRNYNAPRRYGVSVSRQFN